MFFAALVCSKKQCRCKYNQSPYYDCCEIYEEELAIKKYSDDEIYEMLIIRLMNSLTINEATLPIQPPFSSDQPKQPEQPMEGVEFPEFDTVEEMIDLYRGSRQVNSIVYNNWIGLINDFYNEIDINNLADNEMWDNTIKSITWFDNLPKNY